MLTLKNIVLMVLIFFVFLVTSVLIQTTQDQQEELNKFDKENTKESFKNSHLMNLCSMEYNLLMCPKKNPILAGFQHKFV